jgi:hypothetical protein
MSEHPDGDESYELFGDDAILPKTFYIGPVTIYIDDEFKVEVNQDYSYDAAAKMFLNTLCKLCNQPPPFMW